MSDVRDMPQTPKEGSADLFTGTLPPRLVDELLLQNPWWTGRALPRLPEFHRWPFDKLLAGIAAERPLAPIFVIRGPRQIGKTTLQLQIIERLIADGMDPKRILRVQFDDLQSLRATADGDPILLIVQWYERQVTQGDLNKQAREGSPSLLFFDEVQNLPDWHVQLKALVDRTDVRALVTGSSALRIERGRDSLAGRIQTLEMGPFRLSEIAALREFGPLPPFAPGNGHGSWARAEFWSSLADHGRKHAQTRDETFRAYSERGGYPLAQRPEFSWEDVARQLNETVVKRAIQHDLRIGIRGGKRGRLRNPQLLEEMFRMAARYCGQAVRFAELAEQARLSLEAPLSTQQARTYLEFLDESLLIRLIQPHEMRLGKRRGPPKLCLSDHALRAAWLDEVVPLDPEALDAEPTLSDLAGHIAESCAGYLFASIGLRPTYLPQRGGDPEVDFILNAGDYRIPVEIKYQRRIDPVRDVIGLQKFIGKKVNRAGFGVLITRHDVELDLPDGIIAVPLKTLLLAS